MHKGFIVRLLTIPLMRVFKVLLTASGNNDTRNKTSREGQAPAILPMLPSPKPPIRPSTVATRGEARPLREAPYTPDDLSLPTRPGEDEEPTVWL